MTISSGDIKPLLMPVGEVRMRRGSSRTEMFPSVEATKPRPWIHRPAVQISRRCSSSDFTVPGEMVSASMRQGRPIIASLGPQPQDAALPSGYNRVRGSRVLPSGIKSALFQSERYAVNRKHICGDSVVNPMSFRVKHNFLKAVFNYLLQPLVDFPFSPEISLAVLDPFKIAHRHAAGIGENVRDDEYTFAVDDLVGHRRARTVCAFAKNACLQAMRIFGG